MKKYLTVCLAILLSGYLTILPSCGGGGGGATTTEEETGGQSEVGSPGIVITSPTGQASYSTKSATVDITGAVSDDTSVSSVTYTNSASGTGTATIASDVFTAASVSLTGGDNTLTFTATDSEGNASTASLLIVYNPYLDFISAPQMSQDFVFVSTSTEITVSVAIESGSNIDTSSMKLMEVEADGNLTLLGSMMDNGDDTTYGDAINGDNVYSGKFTFNEASAGTITLRIKATTTEATAYSETFTLDVIEHLTSAELAAVTSTPDTAEAQYEALKALNISKGMSSKSASTDATTSLVTWLEEQDGIGKAGVSTSGQGVWWVYDSGILGGLILDDDTSEVRGSKPSAPMSANIIKRMNKASFTKAAGDEVTVGSNKAILIGAFHTQFEGWGGDETDEINTTLTDSTCPKYTVDGPYQDTDATVEVFKDLENYGVVVITSHGDSWYSGILSWWDDTWGNDADFLQNWLSQVVILTRTTLTDDNKETYEADLLKHRLAVTNSNYLAITPAFIQHYNNGMPDSVVYLGSCRSTYNNTMTHAFRAAGAKTVYGYTDYVKSLFAYNHGKAIFTDLVDNAKETGDVAGLGDDDADASPAELTLKGEENVTLALSGLMNGGFEEGSAVGWESSGDYRVLVNVGTVDPQEGTYMGLISTGLGSTTVESGEGSTFQQTFCVPADTTMLTFRYNFISEEPLCYAGPSYPYDDTFQVKVLDVDGSELAISLGVLETIDDAGWLPLGGDYFAGGDDDSDHGTCSTGYSDGTYHTDWKNGTIDVTDYAGVQTPITLKFNVWDEGDSAWDTAVTIDDVEIQ